MTATPNYEPVLHCDGKNPDEVYILGVRMVNGVYFYDSIFTTPIVTQVVFDPALTKLKNLIAEAKGNQDKLKERDTQSGIVFGYIKQLLIYVKPICGNDIEKINQSGFDSNIIPSAHPVADQAVIRRIERGTEAHSVRVLLEQLTGLKKNKKESRLYIVEVFDTIDGETPTGGCTEKNSRKLVVKNIPHLTPKYYSVIIQNSAGKNLPSARVRFILTD
ncbi:MAG: hypothetical protein WCH34_04570 [Bacteroidota bacterium]